MGGVRMLWVKSIIFSVQNKSLLWKELDQRISNISFNPVEQIRKGFFFCYSRKHEKNYNIFVKNIILSTSILLLVAFYELFFALGLPQGDPLGLVLF